MFIEYNHKQIRPSSHIVIATGYSALECHSAQGYSLPCRHSWVR